MVEETEPAVEAAQLVVVVLFAKSAAVALIPT